MQEDSIRKQSLVDRKLREELKRRRMNLGVGKQVGGVKQELKALIYKEAEPVKKNIQTNKLEQDI